MKMFCVKWLNAAMLLASASAHNSQGASAAGGRSGLQCFGSSQKTRAEPFTRHCPSDRPLCATVATSPGFVSALTCAASTSWRPCSLAFSRARDRYELKCVCTTPLCNSQFTTTLRDELIKFTKLRLHTNASELMGEFWLRSRFTDIPAEDFYGNVTEGRKVDSEGDESVPVAAALRSGPVSAPSDDDDDEEEEEGEGSGLDEDSAHSGHPATSPPASSQPAAPGAAATLHCAFAAHLLLFATTF